MEWILSIHELTADIENEGSVRVRAGGYAAPRDDPIDVPADVLRFAPKKLRLRHRTEDRIEQLEIEVKQWQERADRAETRLRFVENSIQRIAAQCVRSTAMK